MDPIGGIVPCWGGTDPIGGIDPICGIDPWGGIDPICGIIPCWGGIEPDIGGIDPVVGINEGRLASFIDEVATIWASLAIPDPGSSSLSWTRPSPSPPLIPKRSAMDIRAISSFSSFGSSLKAVMKLPFPFFYCAKSST
jgi:hypothetical protein